MGRERFILKPTIELELRAHHWELTHEAIIKNLYYTEFDPGETLIDFAIFVEENQTKDDIANTDSWILDPNFRIAHGHAGNDSSVPPNYNTDRYGNTPLDTIEDRALPYYEFLGLPDEIPVIVGNLKDNICRSCAFGKGNGGLHCRSLDNPINKSQEHHYVKKLMKEMFLYTTYPLKDEERDYEKMSVKRAPNPATFVPFTADLLYTNDVIALSAPLGFIRDVLTYKATRGFERPFLRYDALLQSKGLSLPKAALL